MKFGFVELPRQRPHHSAPKISAASPGGAEGCGDACPITPGIKQDCGPLRKYSVPVGITLIPSIGGAVCSLYLRKEHRHWYENLRKPVWCPRQWLFFPVFNACYASMGLASYMVYVQQGSRLALQLYGTQLALAWCWVPLLFGRRMLGLALVDSVLLAGFSGATLWCFAPISAGAAAIFAPTFLWSVYLALTSLFLWRRNSIVLKNG
ncbi:translocator protein-like isoform X1 [Dermacentor albipictus]|uniref:translocator protein-like isoform X1 n=1 Tax=Dermacentor albipictus TaxID=60249 RepID=UPI0031FD5168